eukprot:13329550-Heterocapsa_arctica.AAC.1
MAARKNDAPLGFKRTNGSTTDFELVEQDREFDPKSTWTVLDALMACKWAFIWAGYCVADEVADHWIGYFRNMVRLRPEDLIFIK